MTAIVIDLKDFRIRTPQQVVRVFYALYTPEVVETQLWQIFKTCATVEQKENHRPDPDLTAIASLLDHLIALTKAIHELRSGTFDKCAICGRAPNTDKH